MVISPPGVRLGCRPRLLHTPLLAVSSAGAEAAELAASAGLVLDDWQRLALDVALGERADGRWAAFEVGVVVPRQNGKGSILEARELAGLFLFGERLILHSAHEFKTAWEAFLRIKGLVENTDDLRRQVKQIRQSHADVCIELLNGARLRFVARSRGSGRGFGADCVVLDEAYDLGAEAMGAVLPTLSARPNPQIWYTSSAPKATSSQLHAVRRRALAGTSERLAYLEWSIDPDVHEPGDPDGWQVANPAFGIRISEGFIRAERDALPPAEFLRERLGVPDMDEAEAGSVIDAAAWAELGDPDAMWVGAPVGVVDVSPDGFVSLVLAGVDAEGGRVLALADNRPGVGWVAERREDLTARYHVREWVRDPAGPAVDLPGTWRDLKAREYAESCPGFLRAIADGGFRWRTSEDLERALQRAVQSVVQAPRGDGSWIWSRKRSSGVDISPLVAMTVGWLLASRPAVRGVAVVL